MSLLFTWDGESFAPVGRSALECDRRFVVGQRYTLEPAEEDMPSAATRAHLFAQVRDLWATLPEEKADRFPSPEHLRKWALVVGGFCEDRHIACDNRTEAHRWLKNIIGLPQFEHSIITTEGSIVRIRTPRSMSARRDGMKKAEFQAAKDTIFRVIDEMLSVPPGASKEHAGRAA